MSIRMEDLPPKARAQVAAKMVRERRIATAPAGPRTPASRQASESATGESRPLARRNDTGSKYHNQKAVRVMPDGVEIKFDSQKEARRFDELSILRKAGKIRNLQLQTDFTLREAYTTPEGYHVRAIRYRADFVYEEPCGDAWRKVVEDVKSEATKTRVYSIKQKLMLEKYNILIREV